MSRSWNHQAYAQMLWGDALNHQVESFIVGMGLMRHSPTSRRILWATDEVRDSGISEILGTIWQSETLQHLNTGLEGAHASRLSKVWTKLKIWQVPCCEEVKVCVLLDTDILVRHNLDALFSEVSHVQLAACWRGNNDFFHTSPRSAHTIRNHQCRLGGGINSGVMVLKPSQKTFADLTAVLGTFDLKSFSKGGAEQDYISEYFSFQCPRCHKHIGPKSLRCQHCGERMKNDKDVMQIGGLDAGYNFQIHQMGLSYSRASIGSPLDKLICNPSAVSIFHMSAWPKPSHLILGQVSGHQEPQWSCIREADFDYYNDAEISWRERALKFGEAIVAHHRDRSNDDVKPDWERVRRTNKLAAEAIEEYVKSFFDEWFCWLLEVKRQLRDQVFIEEKRCALCGQSVSDIHVGRHVLFTCQAICGTAMDAFWAHGPDTATKIECDRRTWFENVGMIRANPWRLTTGIHVQIRFAYFNTLLKKYRTEHGIEVDMRPNLQTRGILEEGVEEALQRELAEWKKGHKLCETCGR